MNWTVKSLLALAALALVSVVWIALGPTRPSPEELLAEARQIIDHKPIDERAALQRLESALATAESSEDADLEARTRILRGELLLEIGAHDRARQDFERVLADLRPGDAATRRYLVQTSQALGDYERAASELEELLADEPDYGPAWVESGELRQLLAERRLADCARELELVLTTGEAQQAAGHLRRLAAMDPSDPARTRLALDLRELVPEKDEEHLAMTLVLADQASAELLRAREDFVRSMRYELDPAAVAGLLHILVDAGQLERAVELGLAATRRPELAEVEELAAILIRAMLEGGDVGRAGALADRWVRAARPPSLEFVHLAAQALHRAEMWWGLMRCEQLINRTGSQDERTLAQLYRGLALAGSGQGLPAVATLRGWMRSQPDEPWPGAILELWQGIAAAARQAKDPLQERYALHEVVRRAPDADGRAWLRLAQLQVSSDHAGISLALSSLANAIGLLPEQRERLLEQFRELGQRALAIESQTMDFVFQDTARQGRIVPRGEPDVYVLLRLAEMHRDAGRWPAVTILCDELLDRCPGFPPAVDLLIEANLATGSTKAAAELAVQRLERTGPDAITQRTFDRLAAFRFAPEQIVRIMRADPEHEGRRRVARYLHEQGDLRGALRCLRETGGAKLEPAEEVTLARILADVGRHQEALDTLAGLPPSVLALRGALPLALTAALHVGDEARLDAIVKAVSRDPKAAGVTLRSVALSVMRLGDAPRALELLQRLDRPKTLAGEDLLELSLARLATGDPEGARADLDRSEAFLDARSVELARLLVASGARDWLSVERAARELLETTPEEAGQFEATPEIAALRMLAGESALALELAREGLGEEPGSAAWTLVSAAAEAQWAADADGPGSPSLLEALFGPSGPVQTALFVRGSELEPHDPREAALLAIAVTEPLLAPFAGARLRGMDAANHGELWPGLLEARLLVTLGEEAEARQRLAGLTERFPACIPAWDERELLERRRVRGGDHPDLRALRAARLQALGRARPESAEGLLLRAREALASGRGEAAASLAERAVALRPGWPGAWSTLASARALRGEFETSLEAWQRACLDVPPDAAKPWLSGLLDTLALAERAAPPALSPDETLAWLNRLARHLPDDPRVALALAELELRRDPRNPAHGVARAYGRLDAFRRVHKGRTLAELQPGSTAEWARFHAELDPRVAQRFLEEERLREPGNIELSALLGQVQRAQNDLEGARAALNVAARMCANPQVYFELAATQVALSAPPPEVAETLKRAVELRRGQERPLTYDLLALSSYVRQLEPGAWNTAARQLAPIWKDRLGGAGPAVKAMTGWLYLQALLLRDGAGDRATAREVAEATRPRVRDPYALIVLDAFAALAVEPEDVAGEAETTDETAVAGRR